MQFGNSSLMNLALLGEGVRSHRWSSYDQTGGNADWWVVPAGETIVLGETTGSGCVRHIWMTTRETKHNLRGLVLRIYWDGEETPSVQCPLGDFFGLGHGKATYFQSLPLQAFYLGLNCWFPMPFADGAKITVTNDAPEDSILYFYIDWQAWDSPLDNLGRFHANWRRDLLLPGEQIEGENALGKQDLINNSGKDNYIVLDALGKGHYVGCVLHLDTDEVGWWGEGDDMFFIDGEPWPPRLHGTGTEDYFSGAWNYNHLDQTFNTPYFGYSFKGNVDYSGKHSQYRFHVEDPVYFEESLLFSIEHGHANKRQGDWSSTAYWYQIGRQKPLPSTGTFDDRIPYSHGGIERWQGKDRKELSR